MSDAIVTVALAGNPNSGKTTVFNALTGARQHVGNYPGVTVEKKEGRARVDAQELRIVDLPGTYSLTAYSTEEIIARNVIMDERPDVVVDVVDCSNLERNLYLATQLIELGAPLVLAFNMSDIARARGHLIDTDRLSTLLGVPIVPTVGHKGRGIEPLLRAAVEVARRGAAGQRHPGYGTEVEPHVRQLTEAVVSRCGQHEHARWFAVKLLENDEQTIKRLRGLCPEQIDGILAEAERIREHIRRILGDSPEIILADRRYGFISGACTEAVTETVERRHERSDRIDAVLTNRWVGLPIFALLMYATFSLTFALGEAPMHWLEAGFGRLGEAVSSLWPAGSDSVLRSLLVDGVIGGVGGVIVFLPNILLLFLAIAFLEDTGYMARAAFILDRLMHKIGLHGKSFIPMLVGFGCSVPAVMATRTLETRRDRLTTMLVVPLMSCGAKLPIYALIIPAFFRPAWRGPILWGIYIVGIVLAIIVAKVLRAFVFRGESTPFVMELPPYRVPTFKGLAVHMWERSWLYLKKAGTIILAVSVVMWALTTFPRPASTPQTPAARAEALANSVAGRVGRAMEPALRPMGFDWRIGTALIGALAAKEVFVAQLGIVYAAGEPDERPDTLRQHLRANYTPLIGLCIILFNLISAPCMATVAVTRREANSWRWALFQWTYLTALAWVIVTAVYQTGRLVT
jgi:ferrous iron transport protein B